MDETEESMTSTEKAEDVQGKCFVILPGKEYSDVRIWSLRLERPKVDLSSTIKMPTLKIPKSMKNMNADEG